MALYVNGKVVSGGGGGNTNYQELTYDEYMALTPEQKTDGTMYFLTDVNGDDSQFQPVIYSETEREIGVWIDGKPLYEKTISFPNPSGRQDFVAHNIANVDHIFVNGWHALRTAYGETIQGFEGTNSSWWASVFDVSSTGVSWRIGGGWNCDAVIITFRYTKTTDTAGSGTWTPQGVPARHYSTSEQVVGTWYDGSTLYEQTLYFNNKKLTNSESTSQLVHNISGIGSVKFVESAYTDFENGTWVTATNGISAGTVFPIGWVVTATKIYVRCSTSEFSPDAHRSYLITVRYTKTSS